MCEEIRQFKMKTKDVVRGTMIAFGGVPINLEDKELLGIKYKKEQVVERIAKTGAVCDGFGNCKVQCHNKLFESKPIHEIISHINDRSKNGW